MVLLPSLQHLKIEMVLLPSLQHLKMVLLPSLQHLKMYYYLVYSTSRCIIT